MAFLHNIRTVAKYEAKTLRRSWFFRLFTIGAMFIFTFMNIGLFSPVGDEQWELVSIPSSVPLINLYLLNIAQAIVVIFLAADFLKRDKKLDTNEVLYTRPMSNFEYVTGKTWGILKLFLGFDILILAIGLLMNIISKVMIVDLMSYLWFLLIICVPTILFSLGLAFMMMSVIKNQAVTFLVLLGIAALDMFYLWFRLGSVFDYMSFGLPVFKSGMTGFSDLHLILVQRGMYFCLGTAFVLATILLFRRLPQSRLHRIITIICLIIFAAASGVFAYKTVSIHLAGVNEKKEVIEANRKYEKERFATVEASSINLIHSGKNIEATAGIVLKNDNDKPLDHYILSLNPSLNIEKISRNGKVLKYTRTGPVVDIEPEKVLDKDQSDTIIISYRGGINEAFCYPNYSDNPKENPYRIAMLNVKKKQAFLEDDYVLLTPETQWYPVTSLNYYPSNPARIKIDFTKFTLKVKDEDGLTSVSQGIRRHENGFSIFTPENPLTGITLAIGNYRSDTLRIDSVQYISYYFPGNDYYKKDLSELQDTIKLLVSGIMRELETSFSTKYPFRALNLVQVPVQFHSYPRESTQTRSEVQPEMVLLPERFSTLQNAGFSRQFRRQKKGMARNNQVITDKELQVRIFNSFIRNTFISGENFRFINGVAANEPTRYRLGPSFYFFKNNFYSSDYPVINAVFESHLQQLSQIGPRGGFSGMMGVLSDNDKANLILKESSFNDLLRRNPAGDTIRTILSVKGDWFFNLLRSKAGVEQFNTWFSGYADENKFQSIDLFRFNNDVKNKFGFEFYPYLREWFYGKTQPGFRFENFRVAETIIDDRSRYQVSFIVSNPEPVAGLFNISFRSGGPGSGRGGQVMLTQGGGGRNIAVQGRGMESSDISKIVFLDSMQSKRVGLLLDYQPRAMQVNTLFARNIPGQITLPVEELIKQGNNGKPFEGEEKLSVMPSVKNSSEIIVDNEDQGFISNVKMKPSPLKRLLGATDKRARAYERIRSFNVPEYWQPVVENYYYGDYIRSCVYTRAGTGDRQVTWQTSIREPGYYDIYCYVGKLVERMSVRRGAQGSPAGPTRGGTQDMQDGQRQESTFKDLHYKVYHDDGVEEMTIDYDNAEGGWNSLGRYYLSSDTAKVVLTNKSSGRLVMGDAVKWVKQE